MTTSYRIFKLTANKGVLCFEDAYLIDTDVFKYQGNKGDFKTYEEATTWLKGLSTLKGQYLISEVFNKK